MMSILRGAVFCVVLWLVVMYSRIIGSDLGTFLCCAHVFLVNIDKSSYTGSEWFTTTLFLAISHPVCYHIFMKVWVWSTRERYTGVTFVDNGDTLSPDFIFNRSDLVEGDPIHTVGTQVPPSVFRATWEGRNVAIKKFRAKSTQLSVYLMAREANRLLRLRHSNVLHLLGYYFEARRGVILTSTLVMELMDEDLNKYIEERRIGDDYTPNAIGLPFWDEGLYVMSQIAHGMNHVHGMGYFHRDLKPANVLVRSTSSEPTNGDHHHVAVRSEIKIADFGSAEVMREKRFNPNSGTLPYKAPEQLMSSFSIFYHMRQWVHRIVSILLGRSNSPHLTMSAKTDVYSFGALCCKILSGVDPYLDQLPPGTTLSTQYIINGNRPTIPTARDVPQKIKSLITNCLARNPIDRPDFQKICDTLDPFLARMWRREFRQQALEMAVARAGESTNQREREERRRVDQILAMGFPESLTTYFIKDERMIKAWGKIGQGTDATVHRVEWKGCRFAGRSLPVRELDDARNELQRVQLERALEFERNQVVRLPTHRHSNLVRFFAFTYRERRNDIICLLELMQMDLGQLTLMRSRGGYWTGKGFTRPYDNVRSRKIMKDIAAAMKYLHGKGVPHGDLHCSNVLISLKGKRCQHKRTSRKTCCPPYRGHSECLKGMSVKLSDFGSDPRRCAYDYAAPELLEMLERHGFEEPDWLRRTEQERLQFFKRCDVYSFAVLCYQILSGDFPLDAIVRMTCRTRGTTICQGVRPDLPDDVDEDLKALIRRCWDENPRSRPEFSEIHEKLSTSSPAGHPVPTPTRLQKFLNLIWPQYSTCKMLCSLLVISVLCVFATQYILCDDRCPASCKHRGSRNTSFQRDSTNFHACRSELIVSCVF